MHRKVTNFAMNERNSMNPTSRNSLMERICEQINAVMCFDLDTISNQMAIDGGFDFSGTNLTVNEIQAAWKNGALTRQLAFFISEVLAFYCANEQLNSKNQLIAWIVATIVLGDLVHEGHLDLELEMGKILVLLSNCQKRLPSDLVTELALEVFDRPENRSKESDLFDSLG